MKKRSFPSLPVLLVDDETAFLQSAAFILNSTNITNVVLCDDSRRVMPLLSEQAFSAIVLDMSMPNVTGGELLPQIVRDYPETPVLILTAVDEVITAVASMKAGAFDYMVKPVDEHRLVTAVRNAVDYSQMRNENILLKQYLLSNKLDKPEVFSAMVTQSPSMRSIFQYVEAISGTSLPVLVTGETGVGKELIARAIHGASGRSGNFVALNVAGVDDTLFSDTLFGHRKGAFTGADYERKGLIEEAAGGTLFLDEIGDLRLESQVKLLRLLQEGKYYSIGSDHPKLTDARVVVATNCPLETMKEKGSFRKDLFYRLQTHNINIPPLRERKEDIPLLIDHFLDRAAEKMGKPKPVVPKELPVLLRNYPFPGNVRELEAMIYDALSRHKGNILSLESFRERVGQKNFPIPLAEEREAREVEVLFPDPLPTLEMTEELLIAEALKRANNNQGIAAQMLGLTRRALNNRLSRSRREE